MTLHEVSVYLDDKGVRHSAQYTRAVIKAEFRIGLYDVTRRMVHEVILPGLQHMAEFVDAEAFIAAERYGKTTEERVVIIVRGKGLPDDRSTYSIDWETYPGSSDEDETDQVTGYVSGGEGYRVFVGPEGTSRPRRRRNKNRRR
jgi:hypothetical protein